MIKKNKGFTLIELLVVIAIIGILSSIVLTSLSSAKGKALRASALTTVSGLGTEFITCYDDSGTPTGMTSATTGGNAICSGSTLGTALTGHSIVWPSLQGTNATGYCYSTASTACTLPATTTALPSPFYLYSATSGSALITCTFSSTQNLTCS